MLIEYYLTHGNKALLTGLALVATGKKSQKVSLFKHFVNLVSSAVTLYSA